MCLPLLALALPALGSIGAALGTSAGAIAGISTALSIGSSVASFVGGQAAAHNEIVSANRNYAAKFNQTQIEGSQVDQAQSEEDLTNAVKAAQSFGSIAASASSLGIGRTSLQQVLSADATGAGRNFAITQANYTAKREGVNTELYGAQLERQSQVEAARANRPSGLSLALGIAGAVAGGASQYMQLGGKFGGAPVPAGGGGGKISWSGGPI